MDVTTLLEEFPKKEVDIFQWYLDKSSKEYWYKWKSAAYFANCFKTVSAQWLKLDWLHVTINNFWISYDYVAYKNKLLSSYPETIIDISLVYKKDTFSFSKNNWVVEYEHSIWDPFKRDTVDITWAYAIIKNRRWEFLTLLDRKELDKHKSTAKTTKIWDTWFAEMCMKTVVKKACKLHFGDDFDSIEWEDNKSYDLNLVEKPTEEETLKLEITDEVINNIKLNVIDKNPEITIEELLIKVGRKYNISEKIERTLKSLIQNNGDN